MGAVTTDRMSHTVKSGFDTMRFRAVQAKHRIAPYAETAAQNAAHTVRYGVAPKVVAATGAAIVATRPWRREAMRRSRLAAGALRGEMPVARRRRRWPTAMMSFGMGAAIGAASAAVARQLMAPPPALAPYPAPTPAPPPMSPSAGSDLSEPGGA